MVASLEERGFSLSLPLSLNEIGAEPLLCNTEGEGAWKPSLLPLVASLSSLPLSFFLFHSGFLYRYMLEWHGTVSYHQPTGMGAGFRIVDLDCDDGLNNEVLEIGT